MPLQTVATDRNSEVAGLVSERTTTKLSTPVDKLVENAVSSGPSA
jgi:hypothetical protein